MQMLWVDQVSRFITNLCIEVELMNQCNFLHGSLLLINVTNEVTKN